jgi:hypothetical protein
VVTAPLTQKVRFSAENICAENICSLLIIS